jgi:hypothetical protein
MKLLRVTKHKIYVSRYLADLRWTMINNCLSSLEDNQDKITASAQLIKKYERRLRLLKY